MTDTNTLISISPERREHLQQVHQRVMVALERWAEAYHAELQYTTALRTLDEQKHATIAAGQAPRESLHEAIMAATDKKRQASAFLRREEEYLFRAYSEMAREFTFTPNGDISVHAPQPAGEEGGH